LAAYRRTYNTCRSNKPHDNGDWLLLESEVTELYSADDCYIETQTDFTEPRTLLIRLGWALDSFAFYGTLHALYLDAKMRLAIIKLQAHKEMGQSYAGLYALTEGLHVLKYLSDGDYQIFKERYSDKLVDDPNAKCIKELGQQAQREIESMTRYFSTVIDQWHLHPSSEWRNKQLKKAKEYANRIEAAKAVLNLEKLGASSDHN
jgi:hypothetical protein